MKSNTYSWFYSLLDCATLHPYLFTTAAALVYLSFYTCRYWLWDVHPQNSTWNPNNWNLTDLNLVDWKNITIHEDPFRTLKSLYQAVEQANFPHVFNYKGVNVDFLNLVEDVLRPVLWENATTLTYTFILIELGVLAVSVLEPTLTETGANADQIMNLVSTFLNPNFVIDTLLALPEDLVPNLHAYVVDARGHLTDAWYEVIKTDICLQTLNYNFEDPIIKKAYTDLPLFDNRIVTVESAKEFIDSMKFFKEWFEPLIENLDQCKFNPVNPTGFELDIQEEIEELKKYNDIKEAAHFACSVMLTTKFY